MKLQLKKIKNRPQILLSLFGSGILTLALILMTYLYSSQSKEILYANISEQLSAINKIKINALSSFLNYRKSDARALASSEAVLNLAQQLERFDKLYDIKSSPMNEGLKYEEVNLLYKKYHAYLNLFLKEYMYTDVMIMDKDHGHILFSVNYTQYVGRNLNSDQFNGTQMRKVWQKVVNTKEAYFSDMHRPTLYVDEPVMLVATPIVKDGEVIAVLMLKLPSTLINQVLHYSGSTLKSCETFAVGTDHLLRNDSSLLKGLTVKASFNNPQKNFLSTENINKALEGKSGFSVVKDYRDEDVISAYSSFEFDGVRWGILTKIDESEVLQELNEIQNTFYAWTIIVSILLFIIEFLITKQIINVSVINPLVALYDKAKGFEDIIHNSLNEIYIFSKEELHIVFANDTAINNVGYTLEELQSMKVCELKTQFTKEQFLELIRPLLEGKKAVQIFNTMNKRKDGTLYDVQVNLQLIEVDGEEKFVAIVNDITEYKKTLEEKDYYYYLSTHDHLTQQFNRQMFDTLFEKEAEIAERYGSDLSLIIIDIDFFKKVNDTYGHQVGDEVLKKISAHIKNSLRESDVFARWGGEEFVVFMSHTNLQNAVEKAEVLRISIEKLKIDIAGSVTCSFGVAQVRNFEKLNEVFTQADEALYKAKENGRNRVETIS
ncbi:sensor domain-containing diguanylate cyclase [bacterium]|nr:sensor domain-containing diguanylate cyclase [bacterium]